RSRLRWSRGPSWDGGGGAGGSAPVPRWAGGPNSIMCSSSLSVGALGRGWVAGDIHVLGEILCRVMLEGAGFEVVDLGVNVAASTFVAAIEEHRPDAVGLSAFLTTTMSELATTIDAITESGLRADTRILVGGAPVNQEYADSIGADGYAPNAVSAVRETKALLGL
ncbi:MAG: hypothetical protein GY773_25960, partial [Actinomycetia bacterium]|nr:hypothetical protein [Actinomycetes bacterium]